MVWNSLFSPPSPLRETWLGELHINIPSTNKYMVADRAFAKFTNGQWEIYIVEMKLGTGTKLTDNQDLLKTKWDGGNGNGFTSRSIPTPTTNPNSIINNPIAQNAPLKIKNAKRMNGPNGSYTFREFK